MSRTEKRKQTQRNSVELLEDRCLLSTLALPPLDAPARDAIARLVDSKLRNQPLADVTPRVAAVTATNVPASFSAQTLQSMSAGNTGYKQQSKVWTYDNKWWSVVAGSSATVLWRLDGTVWTPVLQLASGVFRADVKSVGNLAHIVLYTDNAVASRVASVEYVPPS